MTSTSPAFFSPPSLLLSFLTNSSDKQMVQLATLESALVSSGPMFVEYQYTKEGFGYGVYQEGIKKERRKKDKKKDQDLLIFN